MVGAEDTQAVTMVVADTAINQGVTTGIGLAETIEGVAAAEATAIETAATLVFGGEAVGIEAGIRVVVVVEATSRGTRDETK
jgi:hypothetical protein